MLICSLTVLSMTDKAAKRRLSNRIFKISKKLQAQRTKRARSGSSFRTASERPTREERERERGRERERERGREGERGTGGITPPQFTHATYRQGGDTAIRRLITVERVSLRLDHRATRHQLESPSRDPFFRFPPARRRAAARTCEFSARDDERTREKDDR